MAELCGIPLAQHLHSIFSEISSQKSIYGFPLKQAYRGMEGLDLSVDFQGRMAATPLGPAAGPHTQMAQNIVLSFLGGCRIMELKTVQIMDQLEIPRPCIDASNICFNVEWSQELRLEDSLREYIMAWMILKFLEAEEVLGIPQGHSFYQTVFDISVGYNLEGISSEKIHRWIGTMMDAEEEIEKMKESLPPSFQHLKKVEIPSRISESITLSTFHGCPAHEIESIVKYLIEEHNVHVMVKMNPTLRGYERVSYLLQEKLGYRHIQLDPKAFEEDLQFDQAVSMMKRLREFGRERGRTVGCKFTNTLVVRDVATSLPGEEKYLSGPPLHVIAMDGMHSLRSEMGGDFPISFSGGIDKTNVAHALACNMRPVTVCTDLLKQRGYLRLRHYFKSIEKAMKEVGASNLEEFILAWGERGNPEEPPQKVEDAGLVHSQKLVESLPDNIYYHYQSNKEVPKQVDSKLEFFDCILCNLCIFVCPNGANFSVSTGKMQEGMIHYVYRNQRLEPVEKGVFHLEKARQIGTLADFCNECGNCDTFCPEEGAPYVEKPRFFLKEETFRQFQSYDGFCFLTPNCLAGRMDQKEYVLEYFPEKEELLFQGEGVSLLLDLQARLKEYEIQGSLKEGDVMDTTPLYVLKTLFFSILKEKEHYPFVILRGNEI